MRLGASFSHFHLRYLNLDPLKAIKEFNKLNLSWIRLGCYWNEIEKKPNSYSFERIEALLKFCESKNLNVALTVGMKAPRWPEYYLPDWLLEKISLIKGSKITKNNEILLYATLNYLYKTVNYFRKFSSIKVWQVENEPLDPSGPNWWRIDSKFLEAEVELVRSLVPKRKILINLWGNELGKRKLYKNALKLGDIVGLDIYLRHPIAFFKWFHKYIGPLDSLNKLKEITNEIKSQNKDLWIAELQAEPWESEEIVTNKKNPPSFLPSHFEENINYVAKLNPEVVLLWGFEYWYWKKVNGDLRYWKEATRAIKKSRNI